MHARPAISGAAGCNGDFHRSRSALGVILQDTPSKSVDMIRGHSMYALQKQTNDLRELAKLLMKLCEKTGRRLRRQKYSAHGVHVSCVYTDLSSWHTGRKFDVPIYTTRDIYIKALRLLNMSGYKKRVRNLAVSAYDLIPSTDEQLELFASPTHAVSEASDKINDKWGEFVITPALMMGMENIILDRISFGGVKELQEIYE